MPKTPTKESLQEARDELLELRRLMGSWYASIPVPDKIIRHIDRALELIPGDGEPSEVPYA